ncbi:WG repeat-containing protein [Mucilaginibacter paludis]|uniref:WG repeat-containing protein n=1 Tax=Mucilaginibacter paludis DSM 18603 TaxID=714943 RepID=H1Y6B1_9SPHI|nr:WG repeat-containing protein [Mucilaginibacter paludis]EHQ24859.1 hypothetical protein Mucpa_0675 [Mucilaginibacter paludis DSM 18603]
MQSKRNPCNARPSKGIYALLLVCVILFYNAGYAQKSANWYGYYNQKTALIGYKNSSGRVEITARFSGLTRASVFKHIIAVNNQRTNTSYYLLKNGKMVAKDSLYVWDMTFDCEQEGKIRFRDPKTDKVGFLGADGKIAIAALYNDARPFHNGFAEVLYNGRRVCPDGSAFDQHNPCEHWGWDGVTALVDTKGNVIADSLESSELQNLNWHSMQMSDQPADTTLRVSFKAKDGRYYSFVNYEKEFDLWFNNYYLAHVQHACRLNSFDMICVEGLFKNQIRKFYPRKDFFAAYYEVLLKKLQRLKKGKTDIQLIPDELNPMIYTQTRFKTYYTDCGDVNVADYPLFDVVVTHFKNNTTINYQEHFSFLRTAGGYKLIAVAWKNKR